MNKSLFGKFRCKDTKNRYIYNNYARIKFHTNDKAQNLQLI